MKEIVVTNQEQFDAIPLDFDGRIIIKFGTPYNRAVVNRRFKHSVVARENSSVVAWGNAQVVDTSDKHNINVSGNARIVYNPRNIAEYMEHYQIEHDGTTAKLYKAVHKCYGTYLSDHNRRFEYRIGETARADRLTKDVNEDCGHGIHIASKEWCIDYGRNWADLAIIEVEAVIDNIVFPVSGCSKVRTDKVKVLREVPLDECGLYGKILQKKRGEQS